MTGGTGFIDSNIVEESVKTGVEAIIIDTAVFHPATTDKELRARLGLGPGPIVLSIQAMRPLYHPLDIAQAVPRVLEQVPEAKSVTRT